MPTTLNNFDRSTVSIDELAQTALILHKSCMVYYFMQLYSRSNPSYARRSTPEQYADFIAKQYQQVRTYYRDRMPTLYSDPTGVSKALVPIEVSSVSRSAQRTYKWDRTFFRDLFEKDKIEQLLGPEAVIHFWGLATISYYSGLFEEVTMFRDLSEESELEPAILACDAMRSGYLTKWAGFVVRVLKPGDAVDVMRELINTPACAAWAINEKAAFMLGVTTAVGIPTTPELADFFGVARPPPPDSRTTAAGTRDPKIPTGTRRVRI